MSFSPVWRFYPSVNKSISLRWTLQTCVITDTRCWTFILARKGTGVLCSASLWAVRFPPVKMNWAWVSKTPKSWFWGLSPPRVNIQGPVKQLLLHVTIADCRYSWYRYSVHYSCWSREPDAPSLAGSAAPSSFNSVGDVDMIRGLYGGKMCRLCSSLDSLQWTKR